MNLLQRVSLTLLLCFCMLPAHSMAQAPVQVATETLGSPTATAALLPASHPNSRPADPSNGTDVKPSSVASGQSWQISAVGDIMVHETQLKTHWNETAKQYLFDDDFIYIRPFIASADLMIGNFETTLGGPGLKYTGYPVFNTPDTLAEALKRAGFHVLMTCNNHCLDTGIAGLKRTHGVLSGLGIGVIGTRPDINTESFLVRDVNGLKVGLAAYTYETSRKQGLPTLNGGLMPSGATPLIDSFATETLEANLASMSERIRVMRARGAELIVFVLHWGVEYGPQPTPQQIKMATHLASEGVDIIFGSHPHVVQPVSWVESPDGKRRTLVAWSLGNFISNQRYEFLQRHDTEDGLMLSVRVERKTDDSAIRVTGVEYQPLWVHRHQKAARWHYHVLPLLSALRDLDAFGLEQNANLLRARNSLKRTMKVIAQSPEWAQPDWTKSPEQAVPSTPKTPAKKQPEAVADEESDDE